MNEITFPKHITAGIPAKGIVRIGNITGVGINDVSVRIISQPPDLDISKIIDHIPPFTHIDMPIQFSTHSFITGGNGQISVTVNGELNTTKFAIQPLYVIIAYIVGIIPCIALSLWFYQKKINIHRHSVQ